MSNYTRDGNDRPRIEFEENELTQSYKFTKLSVSVSMFTLL